MRYARDAGRRRRLSSTEFACSLSAEMFLRLCFVRLNVRLGEEV